MEVSTPIFQLGFKAEPAPGRGGAACGSELMGELACEALLGSLQPAVCQPVRARASSTSNFGYGFELYPGCAPFWPWAARAAIPGPGAGRHAGQSWGPGRPVRAWTRTLFAAG